VTARVRPPTVIVAVRAAALLLVTEYEILLGPDPDETLTCSHDALLTAVHEQAAPVVRVAEWVAARYENESLVGLSAYVHGGACVIVTELPAMFSVAVREDEEVFGATE